MHLLALSGLLLTEMTDFLTPFIPTLTSEILTLWYTYSLKKVPLSGGAFAYSPIIGSTHKVSMISWSSGSRWWAPGSSYSFCQRQNRGKRLCWNIIWQKLKRCYMKCHYLLFIFCQLTFLYSVYLVFVVFFFFISSTFFHVQYISVYKKTSIRVACVLNTSGLKRVTIKHSRVRYPKIFPVSRSGTCLLAYRQLRPCYSSLK